MDSPSSSLGGGAAQSGTAAPGSFLLPLLLHAVCSLLSSALPIINRRCAPYVKGEKTQDKGINKNFENLVGDAVRKVLTDRGIPFMSAIGDVISDVSIETDDFILQVDAKGCNVADSDFIIKPKTKYFHGHCGIAQTSLVSTAQFTNRKTGEKTEQRGLQKSEIDGKPVYTFVVFMRWGYSTQYYIESCGVVYLPHTPDDFGFNVGKSADEMRWYVKNPTLYQIHRFASESPAQTPDLVQSEDNEVLDSSLQSP